MNNVVRLEIDWLPLSFIFACVHQAWQSRRGLPLRLLIGVCYRRQEKIMHCGNVRMHHTTSAIEIACTSERKGGGESPLLCLRLALLWSILTIFVRRASPRCSPRQRALSFVAFDSYPRRSSTRRRGMISPPENNELPFGLTRPSHDVVKLAPSSHEATNSRFPLRGGSKLQLSDSAKTTLVVLNLLPLNRPSHAA